MTDSQTDSKIIKQIRCERVNPNFDAFALHKYIRWQRDTRVVHMIENESTPIPVRTALAKHLFTFRT